RDEIRMRTNFGAKAHHQFGRTSVVKSYASSRSIAAGFDPGSQRRIINQRRDTLPLVANHIPGWISERLRIMIEYIDVASTVHIQSDGTTCARHKLDGYGGLVG